MHRIKIRKDTGKVESLGELPFSVRLVKKERFSEIVPVSIPLRMAFRILRLCFGEKGIVSDWTRSWKCEWLMVILQGKHKGTTQQSNKRTELLEAEKALWFWPVGEL